MSGQAGVTAATPVVSSVPSVGTASTDLSVAAQGTAWTRIMTPARQALGVFQTAMTPTETAPEVAVSAAVLATAYAQTAQELGMTDFTGQTAVDVRAVIAVLGVLQTELRSVTGQTRFSIASFNAGLAQDFGARYAASMRVDTDLGLSS